MKSEICTNTIVRNGEDTIEFCLSSILPNVNRAIVNVDSRSNDRTLDILKDMQKRFPHLEVYISKIDNPLTDLVNMRNEQLSKSKEKWIWIVDSDEYYQQETIDSMQNLIKNDEERYDVYSLRCWAVWDDERGHKSSSKAIIPRIFRNKSGLKWVGRFGKEKLYDGDIPLFTKNFRSKELPLRYIHFTHTKKDNWREELNQKRVADGKYLYKLPEEIINIIKQKYEFHVKK